MAKIICAITGLTGILNASFELVHRLEKAGHEVICAAPRAIGERVNAQGVSFVQLPEILLTTTDDLPLFDVPMGKLVRLKYKLEHAAIRKKALLERMYPKAFIQLLEKEKPDLVLVDVELHEYIFATYARKIPMVLLSQWFSLWSRKGLPYLLKKTIPGKGWEGQALMMQLNWWMVKLKRKYIFAKQKLLTVGTDRRSLLLALAKSEKFPLSYIKENYWPGPFTYDQLPVISMTAKEMEFPHDLRPELYYVGPMVSENRIDPESTKKETTDLKKVFTFKKKNKAKLIYCSVSTLSKSDISFIDKVVKAVAKRKDWMLVIGMGGMMDKDYLAQLPQNVFAFSFVPQLKILKVADLSINHGGIHTINECIHFKVPMLVYSGKRSDQNGCAARVAYHELGLMADKDKDTYEIIGQRIEEVLQNERYARKIEKLHQFYEKYKSDFFLEQIINSFLRK